MIFLNIILLVLFFENSFCDLNSTQSTNNGRLSMKTVLNLNDIEKKPRIIGGALAEAGKFGYMALVVIFKPDSTVAICGGAIIHKKFILTAGHCIEITGAKQLKVAVGHGDPINSAVVYEVQTKIEHNNYDKPPLHNDIGLLYLKTAIKYNKYIYPIQITNVDPPVGTRCEIPGWGLVSGVKNIQSHDLYWADLEVYDNKACQSRFRFRISFSQMMCAYNDDKRPCDGDSGSPLVCEGKVAGIMAISRNDKCDVTGYPQIFMRVSYYFNWIWGSVELVDDRSDSHTNNLTASIQLISFVVSLHTFL